VGADQSPQAAQLVAAELEQELAVSETELGVLERHEAAAVPDDHRAGAVVALRDQPLEIGVLDRVILGFEGAAFVLRVERRPFGHRPGVKGSGDFQP
jgi:hypothetical protein